MPELKIRSMKSRPAYALASQCGKGDLRLEAGGGQRLQAAVHVRGEHEDVEVLGPAGDGRVVLERVRATHEKRISRARERDDGTPVTAPRGGTFLLDAFAANGRAARTESRQRLTRDRHGARSYKNHAWLMSAFAGAFAHPTVQNRRERGRADHRYPVAITGIGPPSG